MSAPEKRKMGNKTHLAFQSRCWEVARLLCEVLDYEGINIWDYDAEGFLVALDPHDPYPDGLMPAMHVEYNLLDKTDDELRELFAKARPAGPAEPTRPPETPEEYVSEKLRCTWCGYSTGKPHLRGCRRYASPDWTPDGGVKKDECLVCEQKKGELHLWHCVLKHPTQFIDHTESGAFQRRMQAIAEAVADQRKLGLLNFKVRQRLNHVEFLFVKDQGTPTERFLPVRVPLDEFDDPKLTDDDAVEYCVTQLKETAP